MLGRRIIQESLVMALVDLVLSFFAALVRLCMWRYYVFVMLAVLTSAAHGLGVLVNPVFCCEMEHYSEYSVND